MDLGSLLIGDEGGRTVSLKKGAGGIAAKKAGHRLIGSVRRPINFVKDFAEIYEIIFFLA